MTDAPDSFEPTDERWNRMADEAIEDLLRSPRLLDSPWSRHDEMIHGVLRLAYMRGVNDLVKAIQEEVGE